jgi:hypothetical protein
MMMKLSRTTLLPPQENTYTHVDIPTYIKVQIKEGTFCICASPTSKQNKPSSNQLEPILRFFNLQLQRQRCNGLERFFKVEETILVFKTH